LLQWAFVALLPQAHGLLLARSVPGAPALLLASEPTGPVDPSGYLISEKFDGVRAYWDGQQMLHRSGHRVLLPEALLSRLPVGMALDGELWLGRGRFDELGSLLRRADPNDPRWAELRYLIFELPGSEGAFEQRASQIVRVVEQIGWAALQAVEQFRVGDRVELEARLSGVLARGGEGLVLHRADAPYLTGRNGVLLKLKPQRDAEAVVIAHLPGKGRHQGRLGALRVRDDEGREFSVGSGLSDALRDAPPPVGSVITYRHRGLTVSGLPRFATFVRVHPGF
jgi:DNA ligase-1